jgi:UDP-N-acetylglucosamine diphosphorylase/glucosamine-1-phosphate N-acetyltransferase
MKIALSDNGKHLNFAPLTLTKPLAELRMGILTNTERWKKYCPEDEFSYVTENYLEGKYPSDEVDLTVYANVIANEELVAALKNLESGQVLYAEGHLLGYTSLNGEKVEYKGEFPVILNERWDIYQKNDLVLKQDFDLLTFGRKSQELSDTNLLIGEESQLFIEEGAMIEGAIINTKSGPVYVGAGAEIMEGSVVRGGLAMCEGAALKLGTKVYGATTLGPHCKVGGEVNNVIFQAYSNKGHDGFLGNSLIGEWCNLGADSNTSNLKNNYGNVRTYSYAEGKEVDTDIQFMGLTMGDHSKCGINTMFNTATVVGVSVNIYGAGFPAKYIPSFSWGDAEGTTTFRFDKAIEYSNKMMERRGQQLSSGEIEILRVISEL